jgi:hypothetical protein
LIHPLTSAGDADGDADEDASGALALLEANGDMKAGRRCEILAAHWQPTATESGGPSPHVADGDAAEGCAPTGRTLSDGRIGSALPAPARAYGDVAIDAVASGRAALPRATPACLQREVVEAEACVRREEVAESQGVATRSAVQPAPQQLTVASASSGPTAESGARLEPQPAGRDHAAMPAPVRDTWAGSPRAAVAVPVESASSLRDAASASSLAEKGQALAIGGAQRRLPQHGAAQHGTAHKPAAAAAQPLTVGGADESECGGAWPSDVEIVLGRWDGEAK